VYQYRLVNDLGVKNPIIRQDGVFDANSKTLLPFLHEDVGVSTAAFHPSTSSGRTDGSVGTSGMESKLMSFDSDAGDELLASVGMGVCDESA
jgi:hypothetical protein